METLLTLSSDPGTANWLPGYAEKVEVLPSFSIYRLDWLETFGMKPPGALVEVSERIYFCESAFLISELAEFAMRSTYTEGSDSNNYRYGLARTSASTHTYNEHMMGMFGLNFSNVYENGSAVPYYASGAFRRFLSFIEGLRVSGVMMNRILGGDDPAWGQVGWRFGPSVVPSELDRMIL
ncbi:MAG: hypothetical protein FWF03_07730 [Defluviitaleaceae bacterium]|nr:hypothetical protein [Defluviitaleaceae bacterium]